jgi:hypothetical protein
MPLLKSCARCGVTMLFPTVRDGKCFCSPECEALYRDPEILNKVELEQPGVVRKRAAIKLAITLPICVYLVLFPPRFFGDQWISDKLFLVPLYFLVELATGMTFRHARSEGIASRPIVMQIRVKCRRSKFALKLDASRKEVRVLSHPRAVAARLGCGVLQRDFVPVAAKSRFSKLRTSW